MKTYNVKELSTMFGTSEETIRRWIRDKKLKAKCTSKKSGNIITELEIRSFLKAFPKYIPKYYSSLGRFPGFRPEFALGGLIAAIVFEYYESKKNHDRMSSKDLKAFIEKKIKKQDALLEKKEEELKKLQDEIDSIEQKKKQYEYIIDNDDMFNDIINEVNSK